PVGRVSLLGTTDVPAADPDALEVTREEVGRLLEEGEAMVPGIRKAKVLMAWAGVRSLACEDEGDPDDGRRVTRSHALLDHRERDGVEGFLTITGGKLTIFRLMAQETVDAICSHLGSTRPCRTHEEALPDPGEAGGPWLGPDRSLH
ncbi:MAG: FAD-dependent oxidoreductase, partial [Candidatus Methylomirabilales bacterium]